LDLASRRDLGAHARLVARRCAGGHGQTSPTQRWHYRQSIRQDDRKRGIRGVDTHKQIKGRKRHLFVDTLGFLLTVVVTAANVPDRDGAKPLLEGLRHQFSRLRRIWADGAYTGELLAWVWALRPWRKVRLEIVRRPKGVKGFQLLPWRWIVERTFGWLGRYRRLSKDYEYLTQTSEAMIRVAMIHLMVRRLARLTSF
jgi:putative transposase